MTITPNQGHRLLIIGLLGFSAVLGFVCAAQMHQSPFGQAPIIDERSYVEWGRAVAAGDLVGQKVFYQDPLYPYFLGVCFALSNGSLLFARLVQALLGVVTVYLLFLLGCRLFGRREGYLSALIMALYGAAYFYTVILIKASLTVALSAAACLLAAMAVDSGKLRHFLGLGLLLGLLVLLRGNFLALIPVALIWALAAGQALPPRKRLVQALLLLAGIGLPLAPVTVRNYLVGGEFVLTTSQGGPNFYIGNSPYANGTYPGIPFVRFDPRYEGADFKAEAERRAGRPLSPAQVSRFWFRQSAAFIRQQPAAALRLLGHKARLMFNAHEIPDNYHFRFMRTHFIPALWLALIGYGMLLGPALAGMAFSAGRDPRIWFLILFGAVYALSVIAFFVVSRYRMPLVPVLAVFSAHFMVRVLEAVKQRKLRPLLAGLLAAAAVTVLAYLPTFESSQPYADSYNLVGAALNDQGRFDLAVDYYTRAVALAPQSAYIRYNLGVALLNKGDPARAAEALRRAGELDPQNAEIWDKLAVALERQGRTDQARPYRERLRAPRRP